MELRGIYDSFNLGGAPGQPTNQLQACAYWFLQLQGFWRFFGFCAGPDEAAHDKLRAGEYAIALRSDPFSPLSTNGHTFWSPPAKLVNIKASLEPS